MSSSDSSSNSNASNHTTDTSNNVRAASSSRPLSKAQTRKAVEYLEDKFLDINGSYKKRSEPSMTRLPTLPTYLEAMQQLLAFILRIPPVDPSTSLRTTFLLRLTGDVMSNIPGYPPDIKDLPHLLDFLDDLDQAWLAVLRSQIWDAESGEGVDLVIPIDVIDSQNSAKNKGTVITSTPVNQTERTRLRSLLITGTASLEEWLTGLDTGGEDYQLALERAGIQQSFDDLFSLTLSEMGSFEGMMNIPAGMEGTC